MRKLLFIALAVFSAVGAFELAQPEAMSALECNDLMPLSFDYCFLQDDWYCTGVGGICGCPCPPPPMCCEE
jgi:hypothetical protein